MQQDRRFEVRRRPDDQDASEQVVGFGAWRPADNVVLSCRLTPPALQDAMSYEHFVAQLDRHEQLVWLDQAH